ncbi:hypothetical protein D3C73_1346140 [compost metagenome]
MTVIFWPDFSTVCRVSVFSGLQAAMDSRTALHSRIMPVFLSLRLLFEFIDDPPRLCCSQHTGCLFPNDPPNVSKL